MKLQIQTIPLKNKDIVPKKYHFFGTSTLDKTKKYILTLSVINDIVFACSDVREVVFKYQIISETLILITYFCYCNGTYYYPEAEVTIFEI